MASLRTLGAIAERSECVITASTAAHGRVTQGPGTFLLSVTADCKSAAFWIPSAMGWVHSTPRACPTGCVLLIISQTSLKLNSLGTRTPGWQYNPPTSQQGRVDVLMKAMGGSCDAIGSGIAIWLLKSCRDRCGHDDSQFCRLT